MGVIPELTWSLRLQYCSKEPKGQCEFGGIRGEETTNGHEFTRIRRGFCQNDLYSCLFVSMGGCTALSRLETQKPKLLDCGAESPTDARRRWRGNPASNVTPLSSLAAFGDAALQPSPIALFRPRAAGRMPGTPGVFLDLFAGALDVLAGAFHGAAAGEGQQAEQGGKDREVTEAGGAGSCIHKR